MFGQRLVAFAMAAGFCAMSTVCVAQIPSSTAIVRQVDHILIATSEAKELFSLLSVAFQLPVAWPMSDYGSFTSGGVAVGNVNVEIVNSSEPVTGIVKSRWTGFALEPEPLRIGLAQLDARGIRHGTPAPYTSIQPDGSLKTRWTTVALPNVSSNAVEVFLCQFEDDSATRRRRLLEQLRARDGGPLSIHSVREIVYGARDVKRMRAEWQKLLNPLRASSDGVWSVGNGPAIRVIQADNDEIRGLVVSVKSLAPARRFLKKQGLLGSERPGSLTLAGSMLQDLNVTLVE